MRAAAAGRPAPLLFLGLLLAGATILAAQTGAPPTAAASKSLSLDEALAAGLAGDPGLRSGSFDLASARAKSLDALFRMLPSVTVSAGYSALSQSSSSGFGTLLGDLIKEDGILAQGNPPALAQLATIGNDLAAFANPPGDSKDLRLDLSWPVFAGFRVKEAADIARLAALGKEAGLELMKRALKFDISRAYWEATRARANVEALSKSLELEAVARTELKSMADQGMATAADLLNEQARYDTTALTLDEARAGQALADLMLASLTGDASAAKPGEAPSYDLVTKAGSRPYADPGSDLTSLVAKALAARPETRAASLAVETLGSAMKAASADLYPALLLTGGLSYSDPDPRAFPPVAGFALNWSAGARLRLDLGGLPGAVERRAAASADLAKAGADLEKARNGIALDVRRSLLVLGRTRNSLELTRGMVAQAVENLRVTQAKFDNGVAKRSDLLQARIGLLRAQFAVENKTIDVEIAQADLSRALALDPAP